ncbi:Aquaporin-1 [Chlorella sorokiniana]|uniref:Aquaporin-1 n=1 Tax=Chlorella sorokiniana TaxID=3076 RepID=A0A2P6TJ79_CHLSO|nr:Aquaporin-1 [Chlorella sorokiniana]|eukprot:PRW39300.1 Aquaporin-1 [Chlorella sorokiniana]
MAAPDRSVGPGDVARALRKRSFVTRAVLAEFISMTLFVFAGCGTAIFFSSTRVSTFATETETGPGQLGSAETSSQTLADLTPLLRKGFIDTATILTVNSSWGVLTAMAFGFSIMVLAYGIGHVSGCHLNPAVTVSLMLSGNCALIQGIANIAAQLGGSCVAAGILYGVVPNGGASSLGSNIISPGFSTSEAMLGEAVMTCFLCFIVHMTAVDVRSVGNKGFAPLAIGTTVLLGHAVLLPVDGCSINPARSFGPAAVSGTWGNFWVFIAGPLIGAVVSVPLWWVCTQPALDRFDVAPTEEFGAGRAIPTVRIASGKGGPDDSPMDSPEAAALQKQGSNNVLQPGDTIASVPIALTLNLGPSEAGLGAAALALTEQLAAQPELNATLWPATPAAHELLVLHLLSDAELAALQAPELEQLARTARASVAAAHARRGPALAALPEAALAHAAALVRTRSFASLLGRRRLVPGIDMLNHAEEPNAAVDAGPGGASVLLLAERPIAAGEEVTLVYRDGALHRPDAALAIYGFLPAPRDPPLLAALDLPGGALYNPWRRTPPDDESLVPRAAGSWFADWALADEYARLASRLASLPASDGKDEALLASSSAAQDWRAATLAGFRLRRRAGLQAAMQRVQRAWDAPHPRANLSVLCPLPAPGSAAAAAAATMPCRSANLVAAARPGSMLHGKALEAAGAATRVLRALASPRQLLDRLDSSAVTLVLTAAAALFMLRRRS